MPRTILLVDDSETMRKVLKVYLMGRDFEFIEANNGERAMLILRNTPVHLVVADVKMPKMDGLSFVRALRSSDLATLRRLPVILVSSDSSDDIKTRATASGADAFLAKPLDGEAVLKLVDNLLKRVK